MQALLRVEGDQAADDLRSLWKWLHDSPSIRRTSTISLLEESPVQGEMGIGLDAIQLVTGNVWSAASFVMSLVAWRQTRPRSPRVTIRRGDTEITLADSTETEIQQAVAALEAMGESQQRNN
jgi:hypothetical protein